MTGHKDFIEGRVTIDKFTLSEGVAEKYTRTRFGIEFVGRIGMRTHKKTKDTEFRWVRSFVE